MPKAPESPFGVRVTTDMRLLSINWLCRISSPRLPGVTSIPAAAFVFARGRHG